MFSYHSVLRGPNARARAQVASRGSRASRRRSPDVARLGMEALEDRSLLSVTPSLLADIAVDGSRPTNFVEVGGTVFFTTNDDGNPSGIWTTDGTEEGTVLFRGGSNGGLMSANGMLFFWSSGLWKSDGTQEGTELVKTVTAGSSITNVNGTLFFSATDGSNGVELWKSDGTEEGTVQVKDIRPNDYVSIAPTDLTNVGGTLFFTANDGTHGRELWKSDGTEAGTVLVKDIAPGATSSFVASGFTDPLVNLDGTLFFAADDGTSGRELWKSDSTEAGTVLFKDINPGSDGSLSGTVSTLTDVDGTLFFWANDGSHGYSLWKSDGSQVGTVLVKDILPGNQDLLLPLASYAFTGLGGQVFFSANDGIHGYELWKSDGTQAGTVMVKNIGPGASNGARFPISVGGSIFFYGDDGVHGEELWKSDGSEAGTALVKDFKLDSIAGSYPHSFTAVGNLTYFVADGRMWQTDGTKAGTSIVFDTPGNVAVNPEFLTNVNGVLYFTAFDLARWDTAPVPYSPISLFKTDGTTGGTVRVKQLLPGDMDNGSLFGPRVRNLIKANGTLILDVIRKDSRGRTTITELWKSDGTEAGTEVLTDDAWYPTELNGSVYFRGRDLANGWELWKTDGTQAGTVQVKDIRPGGSSSPTHFTNVDGTLLFFANDGTNGYELWKSDGTEAGTVQVKDIRPGPVGSARREYPLYAPVAVDGVLFFAAQDGQARFELWKSDGTEAGTVKVESAQPNLDDPRRLTNVAGKLFFQADSDYGYEWWTSDGTEAGTNMLKDINPGPGDSTPDDNFDPFGHLVTEIDGTFYFAAKIGTSNTLWKSDGTEAGTVQVDDGGVGLSNVGQLANVNGILYFSADDGTHGREPWLIAPDVVPGLYYSNSAFDGDAADGNTIAKAMATDKLAYSAGSGEATFENVSSYIHGINGITVDLPTGHGPLTADDFTFHTGTNNAPSTWADGPPPAGISVLRGAGVAGMDRVQIVWPDGAIKNTWLQVVVRGNDAVGGFHTNTGLESSTIFYFGSRVGDTGDFATNSTDEIEARSHQGLALLPNNPYDFNRDYFVNATDQLIARANAGFLHPLDLSLGGAEEDDATSAIAAALTTPQADEAPQAKTPAESLATPPRAMLARRHEGRRAELLETVRSPARPLARNPVGNDLALDDELLDSLLEGAHDEFS